MDRQSSDSEITTEDMDMFVEIQLVIETQQHTVSKIPVESIEDKTDKVTFMSPPSPSNHERRKAYQHQKIVRKYEKAAIKGLKW